MKLAKAIEELSGIPEHRLTGYDSDRADAVKLGIEALTWRLLMEGDYGSWCGPPLPGETEE